MPPMSDPLSAGISAGSGLLGSIVGGIFQGRQNKLNRQFAEDQSNLSWQRQLEMFDRTNEYNSPTAQMERFKQAGLNPHLMYGQGTPGQASAPTPQMARWEGKAPMQNPKLGGNEFMNMYLGVQMHKKQMEQMDEMIETEKVDRLNKELHNIITGNKALYSLENEKWSLEAKKEMSKLRNRQIEKLVQDMDINQQKDIYEKWKRGYIQKYKFSPEGNPTLWRSIQEGKINFGDFMKWMMGGNFMDLGGSFNRKESIMPQRPGR